MTVGLLASLPLVRVRPADGTRYDFYESTVIGEGQSLSAHVFPPARAPVSETLGHV